MNKLKTNCGTYEPVLFMKRNNQKPLVVVDAEYFVNYIKILINHLKIHKTPPYQINHHVNILTPLNT